VPHQVYHLLFRASSADLQQFARAPRFLGAQLGMLADLQQFARAPRFLGAQLGMLGVLQTWTRDLRYYPHIHYLRHVSESGISA
jgi:hypothetical protein